MGACRVDGVSVSGVCTPPISLSLKIISGEGKSEELKDLIKNCHRLINQSSDVSKR